MFKKVIDTLFGKNEDQETQNNQLITRNNEPKKTGPNIPKMLNLDTIDYYPLPPAPSKWDSNPQEPITSEDELFEIIDCIEKEIAITNTRKLDMSERPDPAYKITMPSSVGFIEIDKNGKAKNLPGCSSAIALRDKTGNFIKEVGLGHSIYRIGLDHFAKHFVLMDKESILHVYNENLEEIRSFNLSNDPRIIQIRDSNVDFYGDVRTSIRCIDVSSDGNTILFTIADSAFLIDLFGNTIWARSMPLGEGWVREFIKGDRVGTSQEVFIALAFMGLSLPVTREQIRLRYRELSKQYHPDLNPNIPDRGEMMKSLNIHHDVLTGIDSTELSKNPNEPHLNYRRTKPDSVEKIRFKNNNVEYELSFEISTGGPALDWIYAAAISNEKDGTYLGTYSGKVIKLDAKGEPEFALDVANVPRNIIEVDDYLYILTDTRLYIVDEEKALVNLIDVHNQGKLAVSAEGFGLYAKKSLSWYSPTGKFKFSLATKHPLRTFYITNGFMVVETRQHRASISIEENAKIPHHIGNAKSKTPVINKGSDKVKYEREAQAEADNLAPATLENLPGLKRAGRYNEAISILLEKIKMEERDNQINHWGVAPAWYHELAIIYRKQKDYENEVKILERYMAQEKAPGVMKARIAKRLEKAKILFEESKLNK
ncbi:MAG: DnaJ domain-containing protein [Bacteroidales bacterium]|nr:DnaJ domain-containing protein [Bacteroidales bacterium]